MGIAYLRAIKHLGAAIRPVTVKRQGSGYADANITEGAYPSATALRKALFADGVEGILPYVSPHVGEILQKAAEEKRVPASMKNAQSMVLGSLRMWNEEHLLEIEGLAGGLGNRLLKQAHLATSYEELLQLSDTKKYPRARIARGILFAMTAVKHEDVKLLPVYTRLLGAKCAGRAFLAMQRKRENAFPVVTKQAELPTTEQARRQSMLEMRACALYTLCMPKPMPTAATVGVRPAIENELPSGE